MSIKNILRDQERLRFLSDISWMSFVRFIIHIQKSSSNICYC